MAGELVAALIIENRKILLAANIKHGRARLEPPGGKVACGEGPVEALEREVYEELGVRAGGFRYFGSRRTCTPEGEFTVHMYLCRITSGRPRCMEPEKCASIGWYDCEDLARLEKEGLLVENLAAIVDDLKGLLD